MVVIDAVVRLVPGVLGDERSPWDDSFSGPGRLLEFAQYTRPREYRGLSVPEVLLGGNHEEIARWRKQQSLQPHGTPPTCSPACNRTAKPVISKVSQIANEGLRGLAHFVPQPTG